MNAIDKRNGFTLIEVLASMAILSILILMLGSFFEQASKAWTSGERQVTVYSEGRGVTDELYRDTSVSIADEALPFALASGYLIDKTAAPAKLKFPGTSFKATFPVEYADAVRMVCAVAPRGVGTEDNDLLDVMYWLEVGADGRGTLKRRASNLLFKGVPNVGVRDYVPPPAGTGKLDSQVELFSLGGNNAFLSMADDDTETLLRNVYGFQVLAYRPGNSTPTRNYFSKAEPDDLAPARVDYRIRILSDQEWGRFDTFPTLAEWHDYADVQAETFQIGAVSLMRGR